MAKMLSSKVFGGKRYERVGTYTTERLAELAARKMRKDGNLARVSVWTGLAGRQYFLLFVKYKGK